MKKKNEKSGSLRPPVVSVLGHVDHGKTTLLDYIRKTNVASREAGGITQSIGASVAKTKEGKKITFIDTPGHAAFSKMRSRGAKVSDIAILVVAADDGVKPQSSEALRYIKEAKIPYLVAMTKIDLNTADTKKATNQLEKEGVKFEKKGGDVPLVLVSGKSGKGIDDLLEMLILISEVGGVEGSPGGKLEGVVIETSKDKRGPLVSIIMRDGTLRVGDTIKVEDISARVRGLFDDKGKPQKKVLPGEPGLILGFSRLPQVGAKIETAKDKIDDDKEFKKQVLNIETGKIPIVIKTLTTGSLEDLLANLPAEIAVVNAGVGDINENDVFTAKSASLAQSGYDGRILAFQSKASPSVAKLADTEGVKIETFDLIYKLFERLEELIMDDEVQVLGKAEILASFPFNNKLVAGCKVSEGNISRGDKLLLMRKDEEIGKIRAQSLKKQKQKVRVVKEGEEFGIIFTPQLDFQVGDVILSVRK